MALKGPIWRDCVRIGDKVSHQHRTRHLLIEKGLQIRFLSLFIYFFYMFSVRGKMPNKTRLTRRQLNAMNNRTCKLHTAPSFLYTQLFLCYFRTINWTTAFFFRDAFELSPVCGDHIWLFTLLNRISSGQTSGHLALGCFSVLMPMSWCLCVFYFH